jgi:D-3-phosphoglycerate dehydrogenase
MAATSSWYFMVTPTKPSLSWKLSFLSPLTTVNVTRRQNRTAKRFVVFATVFLDPKPTVLVAEKLGEAGLELLKTFANVDCSYNLDHEELCTKISLCDALIVRSGTKVTREVFERSGGRLKVVGRAGVGIDNVDLSAATEHGCLVVNAPTANTIAAAEHGIALLTAMARNIAQADASIKSGLSSLFFMVMPFLMLQLVIYRAGGLLYCCELNFFSLLCSSILCSICFCYNDQ